MKHKQLLILVLLLALTVTTVFAQATGDYRSKATGNWDALATWERYNGSSWSAATSGQVPDENSSVYVQSGHIISLTQAQKCKDLHIAKGTASNNATYGRVQLASYALELYGKLRTYYAAVGTLPGTSTTDMANMLITCTGANGKLIVKGSSNRTLAASTEWSDGTYTTPPSGQQNFNIEIAADSGVTITMNVTIRAYSWAISSGIFNVASLAIVHADTNVANGGNVTVAAGATIVANSTSSAISFIRRNSGKRGGTFTVNGTLRVMGTDTAIAMSTVNLNGTVEYSSNGAQNFIKNGGDGAVVPSPCNNVIITGTGAKTLATAITINGTLTRSGTASLALSTFALTYGASSTLLYKGSAAQTTANTEWPASGSRPHNVIIDNTAGVSLNGAKTIAGDLTLTNGELTKGANSLSVDGTTYVVGGSVTGTSGYTDGYIDANNYISIASDNLNMTSFAISMTTTTLLPSWANRQWNLSANYTGTKAVTFYWTDVDDGGFNWTGKTPAVWIGSKKYTGTYNVSGATNSITVNLDSDFSKGSYRIGQDTEDGTLPVELSSFTAVLTADYFVKLHWTTQSETGVSGFYIYRGTDSNVANAIAISPMIDATNTSDVQHYDFIDNELFDAATYYYWLVVQDMDGDVTYHGPTPVYYSANGNGNQGAPGIPIISGLQAIYPNPFNPNATINYGLKDAANVEFTIYNTRGQIVRSFNDGQKAAGNWKVLWSGMDNNGKACATGVYFFKMQAGKDSYMKKAVLMK